MTDITLPENLDCYSRPDLIKWVAETCVVLGNDIYIWDAQIAWCERRLGKPRPGHILYEAQDGWIDYFDGDWQSLFNPFNHAEELVIWFASRDDQAAFLLTWT